MVDLVGIRLALAVAKADGRMFQERHNAKAIESLGDERSPSDGVFQEVSEMFLFDLTNGVIKLYEYVVSFNCVETTYQFDWTGSI